MNNDPIRRVWDRLLPARLPDPQEARAFAPSNIALSKYWGKRDETLNLPNNSSVSVSLGEWGTRTHVVSADHDSLQFNGQPMPTDDPQAQRIWRFVNLFRREQRIPLTIKTQNSIPTAAGLASSASGFAALTKALDSAFQLDLDDNRLSMMARFGSGSACRSLWHGFVRWNCGKAPDGSDSFAIPLDVQWPAFRIGILYTDTSPKRQTSRDGMGHTVATSPLYASWLAQTHQDCAAIETAIFSQDFAVLGPLAEANALAMHASMLAARPTLCYLQPSSLQHLQTLWKARADGLLAYATVDAGPNIKLLFQESALGDVLGLFPEIEVCAPFAFC